MIEPLSEFYRVPEAMLGPIRISDASQDVGFFRFGPSLVCYGQSASGVSRSVEESRLFDASFASHIEGNEICLPFDPVQVIENLRREHYMEALTPGRESFVTQEWVRKVYYFFRKLLPVWVRRHLQRAYFSDWQRRPFPSWPVDFTVDTLHQEFLRLSMVAAGIQRLPFIWFWPDGATSSMIMTHDVETRAGRDFSSQLMDIDDSYGIKASFQVIPEERYEVPAEYVEEIRQRGFEFNIHDLNHDGNLYRKREEFLRRAGKINSYGRKYGAHGFRAGAMYRALDWYDAYEFSYDMSLSSVAHLEPKRGGCCTVFPFFVGKILELPLTTSQDYSVFYILGDYSIALWKTQLELIRQKNGLISFIAHPDYLRNPRARKVYESLLDHLRQLVTREKIWAALPGQVDRWWRARSQMRLRQDGNLWKVEGPEAERARVAFAVLEDGRLVYEINGISKGGRGPFKPSSDLLE